MEKKILRCDNVVYILLYHKQPNHGMTCSFTFSKKIFYLNNLKRPQSRHQNTEFQKGGMVQSFLQSKC